ncbi:MAG: hypothetical protein H7Y28_01450 [Rhodoferax sp.]|nr:hypothetical protein [Rhodoferax sp.]
MSAGVLRRGLAMAAATLLLACSPALNWREVPLGGASVMLPCKPDQAQRTVAMGGRDVVLSMAGCEAAGALFAVSHVQGGSAAHAATLLAEWRAASLQAMRSSTATELPAPAGAGRAPALFLAAQGQRPDGTVVQARLAWWLVGDVVFHMAVYADRLTPEMSETLVSEPRRS